MYVVSNAVTISYTFGINSGITVAPDVIYTNPNGAVTYTEAGVTSFVAPSTTVGTGTYTLASSALAGLHTVELATGGGSSTSHTIIDKHIFNMVSKETAVTIGVG